MRYFAYFLLFSLTSIVYSQGPATWSSSQDYTHPTLVIDGTITYLSTQDVPANTPITNTNYWSPLDDLVPDEAPSGTESLTTPDSSEVSNLTVPDGSSGKFQVTITQTNGGTVSGNGEYDENQPIIISATAALGYQFSNWSDNENLNSAQSTRTIIVDRNYDLHATFITDDNDNDNDSLTNYQEAIIYNTYIDSNDTDGDGLTDGFEVSLGSDPTKSDHALINHFYDKGYTDGKNTFASDTLSTLTSITDSYDLNISINLTAESANSELSLSNQNSVSLEEIGFFIEQLIDAIGTGGMTRTPYTNGWFYSRNQGWMWTNKDSYPYFFISDVGWRYFKDGYDSPRFYDYIEKKWKNIEEEISVLSSSTGKSIVSKLGEIYKWEKDLEGTKAWIVQNTGSGWERFSVSIVSSFVEWTDMQTGITGALLYSVRDDGSFSLNDFDGVRNYHINAVEEGAIQSDIKMSSQKIGTSYHFLNADEALEFFNAKTSDR